MNVRVLLFIVMLYSSLLLLHSEAFISINIEPDDLDAVSDFFHQIMINEQPVLLSEQNHVMKHIKKTMYSIIQMVGIMITLIGANVITSMLDSAPYTNQQQQPEILFQNNSVDIKHAEKCNIDFGCNKNICWRSCNVNVGEKKMWCYTSPDQRSFRHQKCVNANDCSLCWECIEPCHF